MNMSKFAYQCYTIEKKVEDLQTELDAALKEIARSPEGIE